MSRGGGGGGLGRMHRWSGCFSGCRSHQVSSVHRVSKAQRVIKVFREHMISRLPE